MACCPARRPTDQDRKLRVKPNLPLRSWLLVDILLQWYTVNMLIKSSELIRQKNLIRSGDKQVNIRKGWWKRYQAEHRSRYVYVTLLWITVWGWSMYTKEKKNREVSQIVPQANWNTGLKPGIKLLMSEQCPSLREVTMAQQSSPSWQWDYIQVKGTRSFLTFGMTQTHTLLRTNNRNTWLVHSFCRPFLTSTVRDQVSLTCSSQCNLLRRLTSVFPSEWPAVQGRSFPFVPQVCYLVYDHIGPGCTYWETAPWGP